LYKTKARTTGEMSLWRSVISGVFVILRVGTFLIDFSVEMQQHEELEGSKLS